LRNAKQNLERLQATRRAEAAEAATEINVTDLNEEEG
jgi:LmbE family N-acetylglucosaminyl deacetylase